MNHFITEKLPQIRDLCSKYAVESLYLFGSAAGENFSADSDIDFLIAFKNISAEDYADNYFALHYQLQEIFNREIDLLTVNSLSNPYFIASIEKTKELLYAA